MVSGGPIFPLYFCPHPLKNFSSPQFPPKGIGGSLTPTLFSFPHLCSDRWWRCFEVVSWRELSVGFVLRCCRRVSLDSPIEVVLAEGEAFDTRVLLRCVVELLGDLPPQRSLALVCPRQPVVPFSASLPLQSLSQSVGAFTLKEDREQPTSGSSLYWSEVA